MYICVKYFTSQVGLDFLDLLLAYMNLIWIYHLGKQLTLLGRELLYYGPCQGKEKTLPSNHSCEAELELALKSVVGGAVRVGIAFEVGVWKNRGVRVRSLSYQIQSPDGNKTNPISGQVKNTHNNRTKPSSGH